MIWKLIFAAVLDAQVLVAVLLEGNGSSKRMNVVDGKASKNASGEVSANQVELAVSPGRANQNISSSNAIESSSDSDDGNSSDGTLELITDYNVDDTPESEMSSMSSNTKKTWSSKGYSADSKSVILLGGDGDDDSNSNVSMTSEEQRDWHVH